MESFGQVFERVFHNRLQYYFPKYCTGMAIADMNFDSRIKTAGQSVDFPRINYADIYVRPVVRNSSVAFGARQGYRETLTIQYEEMIDELLAWGDSIQGNDLLTAAKLSEMYIRKLTERVDFTILGEIRNATLTFDEGDLTTRTSSGTPLTITSTNAPKVSQRMAAKLSTNNVRGGDMVLVLDPYSIATYKENVVNRNADISVKYMLDGVMQSRNVNPVELDNGYVGVNIDGVSVYRSNSLPATAVLGLATQPTANDTITVNGVVITFVSSLTTTNQVLIGANVDATRANLAAMFNDQTMATGPVANAQHTAFNNTAVDFTATGNDTASDFLKIAQLYATATNDNTANTLTLETLGGVLDLAESLTASGDTWTSNIVHGYFGRKGSIKVAMQQNMRTHVNVGVPGYAADEVKVYALWGVRAFNEGRREFLNVEINANA